LHIQYNADRMREYPLAHLMMVITTVFGKKYAGKVLIRWIKAPSILAHKRRFIDNVFNGRRQNESWQLSQAARCLYVLLK